MKFIAELEDRKTPYLPAFELSSFFSGTAGEVFLLDLSLLSRDPSHRKSSSLSLAKLIVQLYLSDSSGGETLCELWILLPVGDSSGGKVSLGMSVGYLLEQDSSLRELN